MAKKYFFANSEPGSDILSLNPIIHAVVSKKLVDFSGIGTSVFIYDFSEGTFRAGGKKKEWFDYADFTYKKLLESREFDDSIVANTKKTADGIYKLGKDTLTKLRDGKIEEAEAKQILEKMFWLYFDICVYAITGAIIELSNRKSSEELRKLLIKKLNNKKNVNEYLSVISFRYEESYDQKAQKNLLKIAQKIVDKKLNLNNIDKAIEADIKEYVFEWGWTRYGYTGPLYTEQSALKDLEGVLSLDSGPNEQIKHLDNELKKNQVKREEYIRNLNLDDQGERIVDIVSNIGYVKAVRAQMMYMAAFVIHQLLKPFLIKEGISLKQAGMMTMEEMLCYLKTDQLPDVKILNKRWKGCIVFDYGDKEEFLYGDEAKQWIKNNVEVEEVNRDVDKLEGQVACPGNASKIKGTIRIVNEPSDMEKFEEGDILVSIATTPDIVPAMKQAAAIISDVGGLTCHASIVSRELGKACIIGTKFGTKVLQDGEEVELNMEEGIIKRLK